MPLDHETCQAVIDERAANYGNFNKQAYLTGRVWQTLVENNLRGRGLLMDYDKPLPQMFPPEVVGLMLAGMKLLRAAYTHSGTYNPDHFIDTINYIQLVNDVLANEHKTETGIKKEPCHGDPLCKTNLTHSVSNGNSVCGMGTKSK